MITLILFSFLILVSTKNTQIHPCDLNTSPPATISGQQKIGFCFDSRDVSENIITVESFKLYDLVQNVEKVIWSGLVIPITEANGNGQKYYETPLISFSAGSHTLKMTAIAAGSESLPSLPPLFFIASIIPKSPILLRIARSP